MRKRNKSKSDFSINVPAKQPNFKKTLRINKSRVSIITDYSLSDSITDAIPFAREEKMRWFFRSDKDPLVFKREDIEWTEYNCSDEIDKAYAKFTKNLEYYGMIIGNNKMFVSDKFAIDFISNVQISLKDNSQQRIVGRFKGDPNLNKNLVNLLFKPSYRWYYADYKENYSETEWTQYKLPENEAIETDFLNYLITRNPSNYQGRTFDIDFHRFEEKSLIDGKLRRVERSEVSPLNITKIDSFKDEPLPTSYSSYDSEMEINKIPQENYLLNFKNIFPSSYYNKPQFYSFYFRPKDNSIILNLESGFSHDESEHLTNQVSTKIILEQMNKDGYYCICKLRRENDDIILDESCPIPVGSLRSIFKTNWYVRVQQDNNCFWLQYPYEINFQIDYAYKNKYLIQGDMSEVVLKKYEITVNFEKHRQIKNGVSTSIMRFSLKHGLPDCVSTLNVPKEVYDDMKLYNDNEKLENQCVLYANKFGPRNFNQLVKEITEELKKEAEQTCSEIDYNFIDKEYLQKTECSDFIGNIIKIYYEESYIHRRVNKILRDNDYKSFRGMRYYYFSLLHSLKHTKFSFLKNVHYKGVCFKELNEEQQYFYKSLTIGQMILINNFFYTTNVERDALRQIKSTNGSYLYEIEVPVNIFLSSAEHFVKKHGENEFIFPAGSVLELIEKTTDEDGLTKIKFKMICPSLNAFSRILNTFEKSVDLSKLNLELLEFQYLFKCLATLPEIKQITIKIYNNKLFPYLAEYVAQNKTLDFLILLGGEKSNNKQRINCYKPQQCTILLKDFSIGDTAKFISNFFNHSYLFNYLCLYNFNEESLRETKIQMNNIRCLKTMEIRQDSEEIFFNIDYVTQSFLNHMMLKEVNLIGIVLREEAVYQLSNVIKQNSSIERLKLTVYDCNELQTLSESIKINTSILNITISFRNNNIKNRRMIEYQGIDSNWRKIQFINILKPNADEFLSTLVTENIRIVNLNLSNNELDKSNMDLLQKIFTDMKNLTSLDLSYNHVCDFVVKEISRLIPDSNLKFINFQNNSITYNGYQNTKVLDKCTFNFNFNFIRGVKNQKNDSSNSNHYRYRRVNILEGHNKTVYSLVQLSNGNIASCSWDKTIRIWDSNNNFICVNVLEGHRDYVNSLIELSNGNIASCSGDNTIRIWDCKKNYECIDSLQGHHYSVNSLVQLSCDKIASCSGDRTIRIWEFQGEEYQCTDLLEGHSDIVNSLIELSDGNIASCSGDNSIKIWDSKDNLNCKFTLEGHTDSVNFLLQLSNGNIASCSDDKTIILWHTNDYYKILRVIQGHSASVNSLRELTNGNVASCSCDHTIRIWDSYDNFKCIDILEGHNNSIHCLIELTNGTIASSSEDKTVILWNSTDFYKCIKVVEGHTKFVYSLILLSNRNIASSSDDNTIRIWDSNDNYQCLHILEGHSGTVTSLIELNNGNIASCSRDYTICIWDSKNKYRCINVLKGHTSFVNSIIELTNGNIASCAGDYSIRIWNNIEYFRCVKIIKGHSHVVNCLIQLHNGNIASSSYDNLIKVWDSDDNYKCTKNLEGHHNSVNCIIQLTNGFIASCSGDSTIKIWGLDYICVQTLKGHCKSVISIIELSNGNIASCSGDKTIKIWDSNNSFNCIHSLEEHCDSVFSLIQLSNGNIASCSKDKSIRLWLK